MPQLQQLALAYASQLFWLGLVLVIIYVGVGHFMLPKIEATVDGRNAKIEGDLNAAKAAQAEAEAREGAWREAMAANQAKVQAVIAKAKVKATTASGEAAAKANVQIAADVDAANAAIAKAQASSVAKIDSIAAETARDLVAKVAGLNVTPAAAAKAVGAAHD